MIGRRMKPRRWLKAIGRALVGAGGAAAILAAWPAHAHNAGVSTSRLAIHGRTVELEINALGRDYEKAAGVRIAEGSGAVNPVALAVMAPSILGYVDGRISVLAGGQRCMPGQATAKAADTHVLITMTWNCPPDGDLRYRVTLFHDVDPTARHLAVIATEGSERAKKDKSMPNTSFAASAPPSSETMLVHMTSNGMAMPSASTRGSTIRKPCGMPMTCMASSSSVTRITPIAWPSHSSTKFSDSRQLPRKRSLRHTRLWRR